MYELTTEILDIFKVKRVNKMSLSKNDTLQQFLNFNQEPLASPGVSKEELKIKQVRLFISFPKPISFRLFIKMKSRNLKKNLSI